MSHLSDLKKGEKARIIGFTTDNIPAKLMELGLMPGAEVEYKCAAPFNGPICIKLCQNHCKLALRKSEAQQLLIEKVI
ncbi:FeoA domain [Candidatus Ornithobacterium hominis]|uniref:FeoA family protein n=1 Tax=Candidatus Ornithobacterium hominis TaxID=2497989 RepID=UPI0024BC9BA2|nr:FeoA family protein [Candidatus Ornithobacterium hominis]CAI9428679.1 FeoA domain [Candidatus Ornithobacterium hominis]